MLFPVLYDCCFAALPGRGQEEKERSSMMYVRCCFALVVLGAVLSGCSKQEEVVLERDVVIEKESGNGQKPVANTLTAEEQRDLLFHGAPPGQAPARAVSPSASLPGDAAVGGIRRLGESEAMLRICAVTKGRDGIPRVGVVLKGTDKGALMRPGESFEGYELLRYDETACAAVFDRSGETVMISFSSTSSSDGGAPAPSVPPTPSGTKEPVDLTLYNTVKFEQTPEEEAKGIDPLDPKTWPVGYRGPAIERLIKEQKLKEQETGGASSP